MDPRIRTLAQKQERQSRYDRREANSVPMGIMGTAGCEWSESEILAELFKYHAPNGETLPKHAAINQAAKNFAEIVLQNCPRSADRTDAIRSIQNARMTANRAVALNGLSL